MDTKHTPGPWKIGKGRTHVYYWPETEEECAASEAAGHPVDVVIARAGGDLPIDQDERNIALIAAAPQLLQLCEALVGGSDAMFAACESPRYGKDLRALVKAARAILEQVKGEAP